MNWVKTIEDATTYIERNMTEDLTAGRIAEEICRLKAAHTTENQRFSVVINPVQ